MFIKWHLEKKRPLKKTGIEWRKKKKIYALIYVLLTVHPGTTLGKLPT